MNRMEFMTAMKFKKIGNQILSDPLSELEHSSYLTILTQSCVMTASIKMKSSESEAPLRGDMVKAVSKLADCIMFMQ